MDQGPETAPGYAAPGEVEEAHFSGTNPAMAIIPTARSLEGQLDMALARVGLDITKQEYASAVEPHSAVGSVEVVAHHETLPDTAGVPMLNDPFSVEAEDYRLLRQRLAAGASDVQVLACAAPSEPRLGSELAVNLALALGEDSSDPVLVVDANFANPTLADVLSVQPPECFAVQIQEVLRLRREQQTWAAMSVGFKHVHLLVIDTNTAIADRRLDPPTFRSAFAILRRLPYAKVIVALPPPLQSSGVNLAGDLVEGVLLGAVARTTRARHLKAAAERLAPVPVIGTLLYR